MSVVNESDERYVTIPKTLPPYCTGFVLRATEIRNEAGSVQSFLRFQHENSPMANSAISHQRKKRRA
ncbi:hypothetical protein DYI20_01570 [Auritidibacter ignavus]|nr:hypothetical protein DCC24_03555 [Auritidibacter sp. NML100628]RMX24277.1 hypothetical protein DYI20_01570 [Auritidibacter ignavus]